MKYAGFAVPNFSKLLPRTGARRRNFRGSTAIVERLEARVFLSAGGPMAELSGSAVINGRSYNLSIKPFGASTINPDAQTWLVIHGTDETPSDMDSICRAIAATESGEQILTLNWSSVADKTVDVKVLLFDYQAPNPFPVEDAVPSVGAWAEQALASAGFNLAQLNIVGHSYGAYVGEEIAMDAPSGINTIVALDPGQDMNEASVFAALKSNLETELPALGIGASAAQSYNEAQARAGAPFFVNTLNFQTDTKNSWAFYADDSFGDAAEAATAAQAFSVDEPGFSNGPLIAVPLVTSLFNSDDQDGAHDNLIKIFANLIKAAAKGSNASDLFSLENLLDDAPGPWKPDQIPGGPPTKFGSESLIAVEPARMFDAEITTTSDGVDLKTLGYIDSGGDKLTFKI
jgi:pimeloyl-ACP methyl ester carboxylesterase